MYPEQAPWTGIGALQGDIRELRAELSRKAESHELSSLNSLVGRLECSAGEVSATVDELRNRVAQMEETLRSNGIYL